MSYPEVKTITDGAFSESIWGSDGFKTIKVSGQSDVVADSYKDNLTITAGTNITLTTNAAGDSLTIASTPYTAGNGMQFLYIKWQSQLTVSNDFISLNSFHLK